MQAQVLYECKPVMVKPLALTKLDLPVATPLEFFIKAHNYRLRVANTHMNERELDPARCDFPVFTEREVGSAEVYHGRREGKYRDTYKAVFTGRSQRNPHGVKKECLQGWGGLVMDRSPGFRISG